MEQMRPLAGSERATPPGRLLGPADPNAQSTVSIYLRTGDDDALRRVSTFLQAEGLSIASRDGTRRVIVAAGTLGQLQRVFGVTLHIFDDGVRHYNGREGSILLPESLHADVVAVLGLDSRPQARAHIRFAAQSAV